MANIRVIFTDIDDTLSLEGRIPADAFSALWQLQHANIAVVLVTGRPAGWCDHLARMWPVAGVVGENGAFYLAYEPAQKRLLSCFALSPAEREKNRKQLESIRDEILQKIPGTALASDQNFRMYDLAIDYAEDVPKLAAAEVAKIVEIFTAHGAIAKVSSIHVNGWFGNYDKLGMMKRFASDRLGLDLEQPQIRQQCIYVGDSPNDEPAFAYFEHAVGVANVRQFTGQLVHPPRYVTQKEGGYGFAELAEALLAARDLR